jgi:hypothetical protein
MSFLIILKKNIIVSFSDSLLKALVCRCLQFTERKRESEKELKLEREREKIRAETRSLVNMQTKG